MTVFLVRLKSDGDVWRPLGESPTFYGVNTVSGATRARGDALFAATGNGAGGRIEWVASSRLCPLPGGRTWVDMGHAESFEVDGKSYMLYVEPDGMS